MLPEKFLTRMKIMLENEYDEFLESYNRDKMPSLRMNPQKDCVEELWKKADFLLDQVPWARNAYYYKEEGKPGKHPFHEAGVYYIQEASAMAPAHFLQATPGEFILDLCAAPGGKSTQIAADMKNQGLLICNEINSSRAKILSENIERMGIRNALVTNHDPASLARFFTESFDKILVDAPCSGEGMFRKNENAIGEWSEENVNLCAQRQDDILDSAAAMLRAGGKLVYSTCTFAPAEDEGTISRFLSRHDNFNIEETDKYPGMSVGFPKYGEPPMDELQRTIRLWPHKLKGEGHFLAVLRKKGNLPESQVCFWEKQKGLKLKDLPEWMQFQSENLKIQLPDSYFTFGDQLYLMPKECPVLKGLKVLRPGLHLGTIRKNRFEPSHALALTLSAKDVYRSYDLPVEKALSYIGGETFQAEGEKGWYLITVEGYSLGWGKLAGNIMKNHYPKGLRKNTY